MLILTILITLSIPVIRCGATPAAAPALAGQTPLKVEVRLQPIVGEASAAPTLSPATASPSPSPTAEPTPFSLYYVSDTQVYAYKYPSVYKKMFAYMANTYQEQNCIGVLMTGDLVDNRKEPRHWNNAKAAIGLLDGKLPFWCVAGNHDVGADKPEYNTYLSYGFCAAKDAGQLYKDGVCWFDTFTAAGQDFLLLGIGWQGDKEYLGWAQEVIQSHPGHKVILLVHSFLTEQGGLTGTGKTLEEALLAGNPNVRLGLCGHNDGSARWERTYEDGHRVNALMYNFQDDKKNGLGYLRVLTFDPKDRSLYVTTYSPWFDDYDYYKDTSRDTFLLEGAW